MRRALFFVFVLCAEAVIGLINPGTVKALPTEKYLKIMGSDRNGTFVLTVESEGTLGECKVLNTSKKDEINIFIQGVSIGTSKASAPLTSSYLPRVILQKKDDGVIMKGTPSKPWERFSIDRTPSSISVIFYPVATVAENFNRQSIELRDNHGGRITETAASLPSASDPALPGAVSSIGRSKTYTGKPISMDFVNADLKNVLRVIGDFGGLNLAIDPDVEGSVTVKFDQIPWDQALDVILETNHLAMQDKGGNLFRIARRERLSAELAEEFEMRQKRAALEASRMNEGPIETAYIPISYLIGTSFDRENAVWAGEKAKPAVPVGTGVPTIEEARVEGAGVRLKPGAEKGGARQEVEIREGKIEEGGRGAEKIETTSKTDPIILQLIKPFLSNRGSAVFDFNTKMLIVTDYRSRIERIRQIVAQLDRPPKQIRLEARIVTANQDFSKSIGVNWGFNYLNLGEAFPGTVPSGIDPTRSSTYYSPGFNVNLPYGLAQPSSNTLSFGWGLLSGRNLFTIDMNIHAAQERNIAKLVSAPVVYVISNREAYVTQGIQYPFPRITPDGQITFEFRNVEIALRTIPSVTADGRILMEVQLVQQEIGAPTTLPYLDPRSPTGTSTISINTFPTRKVDTYLMVEDGAVIVLGGILGTEWQNLKKSTPGLERLPLFGNLFKSKYETFRQQELLVFISPKIVEHPTPVPLAEAR